jgi:hypothetical protein
MSDIPLPDDYRDRLEMREQFAHIGQAGEKTLKFIAEQQSKLNAEGRKFNCDPWMLIGAAVIAAVVARLPEILHAFDRHS